MVTNSTSRDSVVQQSQNSTEKTLITGSFYVYVCQGQTEWTLSDSGGVSSRTGSGLPLLPVLSSCVALGQVYKVCTQCRKRKNKNEAATEVKVSETERQGSKNGKNNSPTAKDTLKQKLHSGRR